MSDERRIFTRVPFHVYAEFEHQGETLTGKVSDLSLKGLFVQTAHPVSVGEEMDVKLRLPSTHPPLEFRLRAETIRITTDGFGLKIIETDIQAFTHLRNIVAMQAENPEHLLEEIMPKD